MGASGFWRAHGPSRFGQSGSLIASARLLPQIPTRSGFTVFGSRAHTPEFRCGSYFAATWLTVRCATRRSCANSIRPGTRRKHPRQIHYRLVVSCPVVAGSLPSVRKFCTHRWQFLRISRYPIRPQKRSIRSSSSPRPSSSDSTVASADCRSPSLLMVMYPPSSRIRNRSRNGVLSPSVELT